MNKMLSLVALGLALSFGAHTKDEVKTPQQGKIKIELDTSELLIAEQNYVQLPSGYIIQKFAED